MSAAQFAPTRWTVVMQAKGSDEAARAALQELCSAYYAPVVGFLRAAGRGEDAARELAHDFFARVLEGEALSGAERSRGRFRSYLLGALKHFLADRHDREMAEKRGSGVEPESLDDVEVATVEDERVFDRHWALAVIARALEVTEGDFREAGNGEQYAVLKPWIAAQGDLPTQAAAAERLGLSEGAVKVAIHRLRQRFREAIRAEVAQTVPSGGEVEAEMRHLLSVLLG